MALLPNDEVESRLDRLPNWERIEKEITKNYVLENFRDALQFVNQVGELAEEADHHPDILIHSWNNVTITLSTHSEGGLTENDFKLAEKIESASQK